MAICKTGESSCFKIKSKLPESFQRFNAVSCIISSIICLAKSELSTFVEIYIEIILVARVLLSTEPGGKQ